MPMLNWMGREQAIKATQDVVMKILREDKSLGYAGGSRSCATVTADAAESGGSRSCATVTADAAESGGSRSRATEKTAGENGRAGARPSRIVSWSSTGNGTSWARSGSRTRRSSSARRPTTW